MARNSLKYELNKHCLDGAELSDQTIRNYKSYNAHFRDFCMKEGCNTFEKVKKEGTSLLDKYVAHLQTEGKSASTIHAYLSAPCRALHISMDEVQKPRRVTSEGARADGVSSERSQRESRSERYGVVYDFNKAVGGRRGGLSRLTGKDLTHDQEGYLCVRFVRDKGGKTQLQRVLPQYEDVVKSAFEGKKADDRVFDPSQMSKNIDYHSQRAQLAQESYHYYESLFKEHPEERERLRMQMVERYSESLKSLQRDGKLTQEKYEKRMRKFTQDTADTSPFILRGKNRQLALEKGKDTVYDRTALYCTSVFHLSHWRLDVTVGNYMLK